MNGMISCIARLCNTITNNLLLRHNTRFAQFLPTQEPHAAQTGVFASQSVFELHSTTL